jgi:hypothetical protein
MTEPQKTTTRTTRTARTSRARKPPEAPVKKEILRKLHQKGATSAMLIEASEEILDRHRKRTASLDQVSPGPVIIYAANSGHAAELRRRMISILLDQGYEKEEAEKILSTSYVKFVSAQGSESNIVKGLMGTRNPAIYFDHHVWSTPDAAKNAFFIKQYFRSRCTD